MQKQPYRVLSLGGGLDSFGMLLGAIERDELPDLVVFADVGDPQRLDPAEWPSTYQHIELVVQPLCDELGIEFKWLDTAEAPIRGERSLFRYFESKRSMPSRQSRLCTSAAKVERIVRYLDARVPASLPVEVWIGFEAGEERRAAKDPHAKGRAKGRRTNRFPLIEWDMCRCRCEALVRAFGFPVPRKSACVFCPFSSRGDFATLQRELPDVFDRVARLEATSKLTGSGKKITFGYKRGDGTDPLLPRYIKHGHRKDDTLSPYKAKALACDVCGQSPRATKATGCDWLDNDEPAEAREAG